MVSELFPLSVKGALTRRRGKVLVGPVDLELDGQGICVILGPNGSGKTSLLRMLHGIARLHDGTIRWACDTKTARNAQAFVFQQPVMLRRSVVDNLVYPLQMHGMARDQAISMAKDWAARAGLSDMLDRSATVLSGGEKQKVALARALIQNPSLVFLDEPSASLDGRATREIEEILLGCSAAGTRLIMSTHDLGQARRLANRVVFLLNGSVHETGPADSFFDGPKTPEARAFLNGDIVE
ncbi:ABC transporter ATP-binding protein [Roseovarius sp. 2305UL8-3]|uniref:ABC transporter ATP-binding protein n=1 Tax=Roseovarius conchicola TaxID=3121636 RepID=UPI003526DC92